MEGMELVGLKGPRMLEKWRKVGPFWPTPKGQFGPSVSSLAICGHPERSLLRHKACDFQETVSYSPEHGMPDCSVGPPSGPSGVDPPHTVCRHQQWGGGAIWHL